MYFKKIFSVVFLILSVTLFAQKKEDSKTPKFTVQVGGTYFYDETEGVHPSSTFGLGFARIIAKGKILDKMSYQIMGDIAGLADAASGLETRRAVLKQAFINYDVNNFAKFRVGQFKYPFGIEAYASVVTWKFIIPSYATIGISKRLGKEGSQFRDIGAQLSGKILGSKNVSFYYKAMIMNGNGPNLLDNNDRKDIVANIGVNLPFNICVSGSYFNGEAIDTDDAGIDETAFSANISVNHKRFTAQAEYLSAQSEYVTKTVKPSGYYFYGTYRVLNKLEVGARYDVFDKDTNVDENSLSRVTLMSGYYFSKLNRIMINYSLRKDDSNPDLGNSFWALFQIVL